MNQKQLFVVGAAMFAFAAPLYAGDIVDAVVVKISSDKAYGNIVFIKTEKSKSSVPGCHTNLSWDFVLPLTTDHDKQIYAILLAAHAAQTPVSLTGLGTCSLFGSIETASGIHW